MHENTKKRHARIRTRFQELSNETTKSGMKPKTTDVVKTLAESEGYSEGYIWDILSKGNEEEARAAS